MSDSEEKKYPTVGLTAEINELASGLALIWFARGWVLQPQIRLTHEDYVVEGAQAGEFSGEKFAVQQKGHLNVVFTNGFASQQMATKHLRYYFEKARMPVFLVMIDVTTKQGYYLFLQQWLDGDGIAEKLKKQDELTIKVPEANAIDKSAEFLAEVKRAFAYMLRKYPGEVADAVRHDVERLMSIDPNWDIKLNYVDAQKQYVLNPKVPMSGTLTMPASHADKMREHLDYGTPLDIEGAGIAFSGSPIFDQIAQNGGIARLTAVPAKRVMMEMHLWTEGSDGMRLTIPGQIYGGRIGLSHMAKLPGAPLAIELKVTKDAAARGPSTGRLFVTWPFGEWKSKPMTALPYFDRLRDFAAAIAAGRTIYHQLDIDGNRITRRHLGNPQDMEPFLEGAAVIEIAARAKTVAEISKIEIWFPDWNNVTPDNLLMLEIAHAILAHRIFRVTGPEVSMGGAAIECPAGESPAAVLARYETVNNEGYSMSHRNQSALVFGSLVELGELTYSIAPAKLVLIESDRAMFLAGCLNPAPARIKAGTDTAVMEIAPTVSVATDN